MSISYKIRSCDCLNINRNTLINIQSNIQLNVMKSVQYNYKTCNCLLKIFNDYTL